MKQFYISPPSHTQTPNELFDSWLPFLNESELKVLLVIMRKTFGWHKTHDVISIGQLTDHTGMLRETVIKAAKSLQKKGMITREVVGANGSQQTIYSLIITETSNNSYQSVKPTGPVGLNQPVKTDPQKKTYSKETKQKKQQQTPSAVKTSTTSTVVVSSLDKLKITQKLKQELVSKYSIHQIDTAVERVLRWEGCKDHARGVRYLLNNPEKWEDTKSNQDIEKENIPFLLQCEKYDGLMFGLWRCDVFSNRIEFICGSNVKAFKISEPYFIEKVKDFMKINKN